MPEMTARVTTGDASRLINRLCKHFSHKIDASWTDEEGHLVFSIGECRLEAQPGTLELTCQSPTEQELEELGQVVASHLERFAGGEMNTVRWQLQEA